MSLRRRGPQRGGRDGVADAHVSAEQLAVLAAGAAEPTSQDDQTALAHAAVCAACAESLAQLTCELDDVREAAVRTADLHFDEAALDTERLRILERLAHLGQSARVLRFPGAAAANSAQPGAINRRWISVAAAAGLLIGMLAGQLVHFLPDDRDRLPQSTTAQRTVNRPDAPGVVQARAVLSDEELLGEIDVAVQSRRATELLALDALTPTVAEIR